MKCLCLRFFGNAAGGLASHSHLGPLARNLIVALLLVAGNISEGNPNDSKTLTIEVDNASRLYGNPNPTFTGRLIGLRSGDDDITATFVSAAKQSDWIGQYQIVPVLCDPQGRLAHYTVITNGGTLTVTPTPLEVRADDQFRSYGSANPRFTGSITGIRNGDIITALYSTSATATNTLGISPITPVVMDWGHRLINYTLTVQDGLLTIYPAGLIGKADDKSRRTGDNNPPFTVTYTDFVNGEDRSIVTGTLSGFSAADADSPPGTYPITVSGQSAPNYEIEYQPGILTVTNLELMIQIDDAARTYGAPNPVFGGSVTGLQNGDNIAVSYQSAATPSSPTGAYAIEAIINDPDGKLLDYNVTVHNGTLTVNPAPLVGKADDKSRPYGQTNPIFTVIYSGFVNEEDSNIVTGDLSAFTPATIESAPGSYPILVGGQSASNYSIAFQSGTLAVTAAPLTVTADNKNRPVATPNPPLTGTLAGIQNHDNITPSYSTTATLSSLPGDYPIVPELDDPDQKLANYQLTIHYGTLAVTPDPGTGNLLPGSATNKPSLTVTADDKARAYGARNPALTGNITGVREGDNITATYTTRATVSSAPGSYSIMPVLHDPDGKLGNYNVTIQTGTLTVRRSAPIRITSVRRANNRPQISGSGDGEVTYTIQASSDLVHWTDIGTASSDANGQFSFDNVSNPGEILFLRVALP